MGAAWAVAFNEVVGDKYFPSEGTSMLFAPRVGVELLYHIRLMAQFNISRKGYNNFSLTIGFVLGGRPKNNQLFFEMKEFKEAVYGGFVA